MPERRDVVVSTGPVEVGGFLTVPPGARGIVVFAHGTGSSRFSPRNAAVARALQEAGLATLLMDLLTEEEERAEAATGHLRFDIPMLAERLVGATRWLRGLPETAEMAVAYFGASTGAGAALVAAAKVPEEVGAVVSRGGRPDLAGEALGRVRAPTLLIVGSLDEPVIEMNREAMGRLTCEARLEIVPGASHLFEEPGTLEEVARLARDWLVDHLLR